MWSMRLPRFRLRNFRLDAGDRSGRTRQDRPNLRAVRDDDNRTGDGMY
jgi:hypothetical protein